MSPLGLDATRPDSAELYQDTAGEWRWSRHAPNGLIVAASTEGYAIRIDAVDNYYRVAGADAPDLIERPK